ncbi:hypothetical protein M427DRAFT_68230 [Gonapodya prolifera JEL478]|uniref:Domain of unknown function at the cortex 1 domain-containing protein n=1 Tax=Gonapodya prolifera (strain JEL478) TaxID=1344416 RepID=A0A139AMN6_GONPJ|nr:hypothetical protein M427DRAFT_68230 [Gonapodya prolifera JEL478]|eukprot:KXS17715.1 hypothetical protein M427DRAFT_68230 [Gonapodya prolifera JEL478]
MVVRVRVGFLGCVFLLNTEDDPATHNNSPSHNDGSSSRHTHSDLSKYIELPVSDYACSCGRRVPPPTMHWVVPNSHVIAIDTPHFSGELVVHVRRLAYRADESHPSAPRSAGSLHPTDSTLRLQNPDPDPYFRTRKRVMAFQLRGRFKPTNLARPDLGYRWTGRDIHLVGHCDRKLNNVPLTIRIATEFVRMFDSGFSAAHMLDKEQPWVSTPVVASMDAIAVVPVGEGLTFKDVLARGGKPATTAAAVSPPERASAENQSSDSDAYPPPTLHISNQFEADHLFHSEFFRRLRDQSRQGKATEGSPADANSAKYAGSDDTALTDKTLTLTPGLAQPAVHFDQNVLDHDRQPHPVGDHTEHDHDAHSSHSSHTGAIGSLARKTSEMFKHALHASHSSLHHNDSHSHPHKGLTSDLPHYPPLPLPKSEPWVPSTSVAETLVFGTDHRKVTNMDMDSRVKARKKHFSDFKEQDTFVFHEDNVYEMEFYQAYVDMNDLKGKIGISIDGLKYTDAQPVRLSFATPDRRAEFFTIEFVYE